MRILIHGCYKREKYVYEHLIPSLKAQGVEDVPHIGKMKN
jgi:hypothetical protein